MIKKLLPYLIAGLVLLTLALQMRGVFQIPAEISVLGLFNIHLYSLCLLGAVAVAVWLAWGIIPQDLKDKINVVDFLLWILIPGVVGARLYHVVTDYNLYTENLVAVFYIWQGGLGIVGGILGGAVGAYFYSKTKGIRFSRLLAVLATVLPVAQAAGRLGNLFNQELYGPPADFPWAIYIKPENRIGGYEPFDFFHPLFLYEMLANLVLFAILYRFYRRGWNGYRLTFYYIAGYGAIRFALDFFRLEGATGAYGLSYTQWLILIFYALVLAFGAGYQVWYKREYGKWFTKAQ
ncbi:MAG: prolipoprotein diacylglyceryl transferase [Candidatus Doudnabacteria bacterium]|nr:prolipoprotein diacylglyceryl transferase [Candidatus Doudnabacteria bacterium]